MPLTSEESAFLAPYVFEYMRVEPGPATRRFRGRGFVYTDVIYLMDAYMQTHGLETSKFPDKQGNLVEEEGFGRYDPNPPDPPWPDRESAQRRNAELEAERDRKKNQTQ